VAAAALSIVAVAASPSAQGQGINITYSELKLGVWDHDTKALRGREKGIDINPEVIFGSPFDDEMVAGLPAWLHWLSQLRPTVGAALNTDGLTDQYYLGGTWSWFLARNLINPADGIVFSFFFGPGFNDGQLHHGDAQRKALGSHVLFREAAELGYQINETWQISSYLDHVSNGGLAKENQSINDLGIRLGVRF
jgi:lipid A 3-O-deacylase